MSKSGTRRARGQGVDLTASPEDAARAAALRHVSDDQPGIVRRRAGKGFSYTSPDRSRVRDRPTLERIRSLAIPPAWTGVWISPIAHGHIQATGRDARNRKQYRYHPRWREVRDATKYDRLREFGHALPAIRRHVEHDLALPGLPREKVLAIVVSLLEATVIRVGNEEYARTNHSYGLTTMQNRHITVDGGQMRFRFRGKSGKVHDISLTDRRLARLVQRCRDLPGQDLFQYVDDAGEPQPIDSADVNEYLRQIAGEDFTAKDFRTWAGTLIAAEQLDPTAPPGKTEMLAAVVAVAARLGNTAAVCRKCYIHPAVLNAFEDDAGSGLWAAALKAGTGPAGLAKNEAALLRFLERSPALPAAA